MNHYCFKILLQKIFIFLLLVKKMLLNFFLFIVLTPADHENHVEKHGFTVPFVCGARNLGEALRRISEGAAMIRTKGEAGTGQWVGQDRARPRPLA